MTKLELQHENMPTVISLIFIQEQTAIPGRNKTSLKLYKMDCSDTAMVIVKTPQTPTIKVVSPSSVDSVMLVKILYISGDI